MSKLTAYLLIVPLHIIYFIIALIAYKMFNNILYIEYFILFILSISTYCFILKKSVDKAKLYDYFLLPTFIVVLSILLNYVMFYFIQDNLFDNLFSFLDNKKLKFIGRFINFDFRFKEILNSVFLIYIIIKSILLFLFTFFISFCSIKILKLEKRDAI